MPNRRRSSLQLLIKFLPPLAHIRVSHVHLSEEVVRQTAVVVQSREISATDVADLQLLVARGTRCILEVLELTLALFLLVLCCANLVQFVEGLRDGAGFAEDRDFEEARVYCFG